MSKVIRDLAVQLRLEATNFNNGIRQANREAELFQRQWKPTTQLLKDVGTQMTAAGKVATLGLTAPIVAMGAFAVKNFNESARAAALMENAIRSTGGAAGKTSEQLKAMATSLEANTMFGDDEIIQKVITQLLTFTNVSGAAFDRGAKAALNMSTVLGQDLQTSALQVGKALNDPIAGVTALQRAGVKLSEAQKEQVKAFMAVNDVASAQAVILNELEKEFGGAAEAAAKVGSGPMVQLQNQIGNLTEDYGELIQNALRPFILAASDVVKSMDAMSDSTKTAFAVIAGGAALIGPTLLTLGQLSFAVSGLMSVYTKLAPVIMTTVIPAITAFGAALAAVVAANAPLILAIAGIGALLYHLDQLQTAQEEATDAQDRAEQSAIRAAKSLKENYGIEIEKGTKTTIEWERALAEAAATAAWFAVKTKEAAAAAEEMNDADRAFLQRSFRLSEGPASGPGQLFREQAEAAKTAAKELAEAAKRAAKEAEEAWKDWVNNRFADLNSLSEKLASVQREATAFGAEWLRPKMPAAEAPPIGLFGDFDEAMRQSKLLLDSQRTLYLEERDKILKDQKRLREEQEEAYRSLLNSIRHSAGEVFDAMLTRGKSVFSSLADFVKGLGQSVLRSIFQELAAALASQVLKTTIVQSALGALAGLPVIGGLFGGAAGAGAAAGGAAAGGAAAGGAGLSAAAMAGLGIAGAAAIPVVAGIAWAKSQAHHEASTFVREFQNPLQKSLSAIVDTGGDATTKLAQVNKLWEQFNAQGAEFAKGGSDEQKVVRQAVATLTPLFEDIREKLIGEGAREGKTGPLTQVIQIDGRTLAKVVSPHLYAIVRTENYRLQPA